MTPCIQPNPDISGIGVRVSVYAQAFLVFLRLFIIAMDGKITGDERLAMDDILVTNELTACALLVSAIIQARTYGLSTYHANIVLVLSWITFVPTFATVFIWLSLTWARDRIGPKAERLAGAEHNKLNGSGLVAVWLHYSVVAGLGIWVWSDVKSFGNQPHCTPLTFVVIFGHNILVTNHRLKIAALFLYANYGLTASILPVLFVLRWCLPGRSKSPSPRTQTRTGETFTNALTERVEEEKLEITNVPSQFAAWFGALLTLGVEVLLVVSTEVLITRSEGMVFPGESQWTFGQSLAVFLVIIPLVSTIRELRRGYQDLQGRAKTRKLLRIQVADEAP